jgi:hypothetical protein
VPSFCGLEDDVRQLGSDNNSKDKTLKQQVRVISCFRRDVASMGSQCVELKTILLSLDSSSSFIWAKNITTCFN